MTVGGLSCAVQELEGSKILPFADVNVVSWLATLRLKHLLPLLAVRAPLVLHERF